MSKGSKQRPSQVPEEQVSDNWNLIFGKKQTSEQSKELANEAIKNQKDALSCGRANRK
jgi:hypothetical protein